ncbi:MAG TPA: hypothetical protein VHC70_15150 [Phycisphaerales bacterium]|nr:hypothetical protein [Phycisphaerales bacterium]
MPIERSVHDNEVYAYSVACTTGRVTLHTVYRQHDPAQYTDVVFHGVVAHFFEHTLPTNILFDIEESDIESLVRENRTLFESSRRSAWPPLNYSGDLQGLMVELQTRSVRAFQIVSSLGLSGWVLCTDCQRVPRDGPASIE